MAWLQARRALRRGYRHWNVGSLGEAVKRLEEARLLSPRAPGPAYYLARAFSELGRFDEAIATIDSAIELAPDDLVGRVFRAIVIHDHRPASAAREALAPLGRSNLLARALGGLVDLSESLGRRTDPAVPVRARFPLAARWLAEVSGRALALLEDRFLRLPAEEWVTFHHALFGPHVPGSRPPAVTFRSQKEWRRQVDDAYCGGHYARVDELCAREEAEDWRSPSVAVYQAFSLLATGNARRGIDVATEALAVERTAGDLHFVQGLCHARLGQVRDAGWSFTRSARLLDTEVDDVLKEVSRRLEVRWTYEDP